MKVILAGATGDVGFAVLKRCIEDKRVTRVTALTLNEVPKELSRHPKVTILKQDDYTNISDFQLFQLRDSEACIWCIGGTASDYPDLDTARAIQVTYPVTAAELFAQKLLPQHCAASFRFVFCSAGLAERDASKKLSFAAATRRLKGEAEAELLAVSERHPGFEVVIERPMGIIKEAPTVKEIFMGAVLPNVRVSDLAAVMVEAAVAGQDAQVYENRDIARKGKSLMGY